MKIRRDGRKERERKTSKEKAQREGKRKRDAINMYIYPPHLIIHAHIVLIMIYAWFVPIEKGLSISHIRSSLALLREMQIRSA